jgi:hypothetical protein
MNTYLNLKKKSDDNVDEIALPSFSDAGVAVTA